MNFSDLESITKGKIVAFAKDRPLSVLLTDSRKPVIHEGSIFFAITGTRNDGHDYIRPLYESGITQFVVEKNYPWESLPGANAFLVSSSVDTLQQLANYHRQQFSIPVIGITGSNGKTIIKEWLYQLLSYDVNIIKNPASYNSQIGVPLSVWQMQSHHQLGIFEAGISKPGEMRKLQAIIKPTLGVFANIGTAHDENFPDRLSKIREKLSLFQNVKTLIYCADHKEIDTIIKASGIPSLSWGKQMADAIISPNRNSIKITWRDLEFTVELPFADAASIENALHCIVVMLELGVDNRVIQQRVKALHSVPMRLELKDGINRCQVIDDTYNNDLGGLQISLDFLNHQQQKKKRSLILSDILQSGLPDDQLTSRIAELVNTNGLSKFIGVGPVLYRQSERFKVPFSFFFQSTEDFLDQVDSSDFQDEIVLVKGARIFKFEQIVKRLQKKVHGTVMEVNLGALIHNLNYFKSRIRPDTKVMVMVKAFAYGSGSIEIANVLQFHQVDYLGVAYADEGVELRENNITIPIMVMNPSADGFPSMIEYNLEPEIYSFHILNDLISFLGGKQISVHLKLDTGMHRLGFDESEIDRLIVQLKENPNIKVLSIFSHLAGSDAEEHDDFSKAQADQFLMLSRRIIENLGIHPLLHILNTSGILRLPDFQFDMVRLGIGLYGVDPTGHDQRIKPVVTLTTVVSQIKLIRKGGTIGYGRKGVAKENMRLATIAIGYADGYSRAFSQGVGEVLVNGKRAPVIGNVCMDMTMIDISGIEAEEGDEVTIFGNGIPILEVAMKINTIPYEILTNTSDRVKRIFVAESL